MKFIDPTLIPATGNPEIDRDHRKMAETMNRVYDDWQQGKRCPELAERMEELKSQIVSHFAKETTISRGAGYKEWLIHHQEHKRFLGRFNAFLESCRKRPGPDNANIEMFMELERHLFEHEVLTDQEMWGLWSTPPHEGANKDGLLIGWKPEYAVGVEQIDGQHRRLIDMLNEIHRRMRDETPPLSYVIERLKAVFQEAVQHFLTEEKYFAQLPDALAEQHRGAHEGLIRELKRAIDDHESADLEGLAALIEGYLKFWMLDHILNTDSRLREFLK